MCTSHRILLAAVMAGVGMAAACGREDTDEPPADAAEKQTQTTAPVSLARTAAPEGAQVYFIIPADGDVVTNPVTVEFGLEGMSVVPAGAEQADSGHHHLIIDADLPQLDAPIPASDHYLHFGDGSTSTELTLDPGRHSLQLLLGDHRHVPHDPPVLSDPITITVQ